MTQIIDTSDETRHRPRVRTEFPEESKTVQSDRLRSEMKHLLQTYDQTGVLVDMRDVDLAYRDVSEFEDFSDLMLASANANAAFMRLPSKVREVFDHDVSKWLDAAHDPEKLDELRPQLTKLGVLEEIAPELDDEPVPASPPEPPPVSE